MANLQERFAMFPELLQKFSGTVLGSSFSFARGGVFRKECDGIAGTPDV